nr:putative fatty-acid--CoA ligase FadD21 [uncultured bacterium]
MKTFVEILRARAQEEPHACAFAFLTSDGAETRVTYAELEARARALAARLQDRGAAGERVLIVLQPGLNYVIGVFGCLFAGSTAVPCALSNKMERARQLPTIAIDSGAKFAIAGRTFNEHPDFAHLEWIAVDSTNVEEGTLWREPALNADQSALLQYTSGTTSSPRGVMVSHANLLANARSIAEGFGHHPKDLWGVTWLPPYHDMGLMGGILQPVYVGAPCAVISPLDFVRRPLIWLEAVSRYRVRISGGPNFAYELCARTITSAESSNCRLDSWELAYVGAEPVRVDTLDLFASKFAPLGFKRESFFPCYGLAEATLYVSGGRAGVRHLSATGLREHRVVDKSDNERLNQDADARAIVGCGRPASSLTVSIVNPETERPCEIGSIGEIWVSGPTVASGYWNKPEDTRDTFHARLAEGDDRRFLRTGDLGFVRDGELFVTGRWKDLIIVRGRNHYPQDIENTVVGSSPAIRPGTCAAFSIDSDTDEKLVLVLEMPRPRPERLDVLAGDIRQAVVDAHELQVSTIVLVRPGAIPRTSSGKARRLECRTQYMAGALERLTAV